MLNFLNTFAFVSGLLLLMYATVQTPTEPLTAPEQPETTETVATANSLTADVTLTDVTEPLTTSDISFHEQSMTTTNSHEQVQPLTSTDITLPTDYSQYTVKQLRTMLTVRGVRGVSKYRKEQLLTTLTELDRQLT